MMGQVKGWSLKVKLRKHRTA